MSRISKEAAKSISYKLTEKSRLIVAALHEEYREMITTMYEDHTPAEIKAVKKLFPDWFCTRSEIYLNGHGFNREWITSTRPVIANSNDDCNLHLTAKSAAPVFKAKTKWEKADKKYKELRRETESALLALKTYNNIRKELPDAAPYLPPPMSNALVVNFDGLKKRLNSQPTTTAEANGYVKADNQ